MRLVRTLTSIAALAAVTMAALASLIVANVPEAKGGTSDHFFHTACTAMALVGAFVATRRPRNPVGWLFMASALLLLVQAFGLAYARYVYSSGATLPGPDVAAWLGLWIWSPAVGFVGLIFMVFPNGEPPTTRWRWVVRIATAATVAIPFSALLTLGAPGRVLLEASSPEHVPGGEALATLANLGLPVVLLIGFVALILRLTRARGIERLQMKWFVYGASFVVLAGLLALGMAFAGVEDPTENPIQWASLLIGFTAMPVAAAIAILRYRLYDIDRIISRTFSYGIITAILGGLFVLVALLPTAIFGGEDSPDWLIAVATLLVVALFRPVRRRVQTAVDRRFNRARYNAEHTIDAFTAHLREEVDLDALGSELRSVVAQTMQPTHVSLWVKEQA